MCGKVEPTGMYLKYFPCLPTAFSTSLAERGYHNFVWSQGLVLLVWVVLRAIVIPVEDHGERSSEI